MWQTSYSVASHLADGFIGIAASKEIRYQALYSLQISKNTQSSQQSAIGDYSTPSMHETAARLQQSCKSHPPDKAHSKPTKEVMHHKLVLAENTGNKSHWLP